MRRETDVARDIDRMKTGRLVFFALCLAAGLVLSYVESLLPFSLGVPGAKVGLPNIVTLILLYSAGFVPAFLVSAMRVVLSGFMFGNLFAILYSFSGLILSIIVMALLKKSGLFTMTGVSVAGGTAHNMGQLIAAAAVTDIYVFSYAPFLVIAGVLSGVVVGIAGGILAERLAPILRKTTEQL